ncbi:MAG: aspartate carbamoyltransferase [Betaproteobacteria bacterium]|nr:aspartate carbamoyltransferase [Betaproteobacteria bacterium]PWB64151.1 MAG: aspartate carbamoyltransferase [Betaproteobacteria bacterium]
MKDQQSTLRETMKRQGLTRDAFAEHLGVSRRALDSWLLPATSGEFRRMPGVVAKLVGGMPAGTEPRAAGELRLRFTRKGKPHLLSVDQFDRDTVEELLQVAEAMEPIARRRKVTRVLEGAVLANLFFEPSTRTRVSFGAAFCRLGGSVCDTTGFTFSSMVKGESIADTSRVVSGYVDAIVVRHPDKGSVAEFARHTHLPVINGGDGTGEHPTQALLDLYTIRREFERLGKTIDGATVAMVGDLRHGRTVHSLIRLLSLFKRINFRLVAPRSLEMPPELVEAAKAAGHKVVQVATLAEGLRDVDVLYATRIQKERMSGEALEAYPADFRIDRRVLGSLCRPDTVVMHPLPRDGTPGANDLSTDLDADPRLAIFRQTDNGIPVRMAIFAVLLGVEHLVARDLRDAPWIAPARLGPGDAPFHRLA